MFLAQVRSSFSVSSSIIISHKIKVAVAFLISVSAPSALYSDVLVSAVHKPNSWTQRDLKSSRHSALKRRGQRWILVSETEREAFVNGQKI